MIGNSPRGIVPSRSATFTVADLTDTKIFIVDQDIGMSVTNDAENVVAFILQTVGNRRIIYKDTQGRWDELAHNGREFTGFKPYAEELP